MAINTARKPRIGVTLSDRGNRVLWWFIWLGVALAGGRAVWVSPNRSSQPLERFDGFIISGGKDIHPSLYDQAPLGLDKHYDPPRDALESHVIQYASQNRLPLFGICRGMQMINVVHGGTLHQEAQEILEDFLPSKSLFSKVIGRREIAVNPHSQLYRILGGHKRYFVNSIHHQAVNVLANDFSTCAKEKNGLIQAIEYIGTQHPLMFGVQWHPELMLHANSARRLFREIVYQSRKRREDTP